MTFSPALWNRALLRELLEPQWDLWAMEREGTEKMARFWPRFRSVGIRPAPILRAHGLYHAQPNYACFQGMAKEDLEACLKILSEEYKWTA